MVSTHHATRVGTTTMNRQNECKNDQPLSPEIKSALDQMGNNEDSFQDKYPFDFYSNGCHLTPIQVEMAGKMVWIWAVSNNDDDVYYQGEPMEINLSAETQEGLVKEVEPEPVVEEEEYIHNDNDWK